MAYQASVTRRSIGMTARVGETDPLGSSFGEGIAAEATCDARTPDPSQAWVKVSIAEATRMSIESMQIVARSKAICLRSRGAALFDPA